MCAERYLPAKKKKVSEDTASVCIVHCEGLQKYGEIKLLSTVQDSLGRLDKLQKIKTRRLAQPPSSAYRMEKTCVLIPDVLQEYNGYHQVCYKRFCSNLDRLKEEIRNVEPSTSRNSRTPGETVIFKPDCIFCNSANRKNVKVKGCWSTEGMSVFNKDGWMNILDLAEKRNDEKLLRRIRGYDLFASEAKFHQSCRVKYCQEPDKLRSSNKEAKKEQKSLRTFM